MTPGRYGNHALNTSQIDTARSVLAPTIGGINELVGAIISYSASKLDVAGVDMRSACKEARILAPTKKWSSAQRYAARALSKSYSTEHRKLSITNLRRCDNKGNTVYQVDEVVDTMYGDVGGVEHRYKSSLLVNEVTNTVVAKPSRDDNLVDDFAAIAAKEKDTFHASDVTSCVERIFVSAQTSLIPLREAGGVHFVFEDMLGVANEVEQFLKAIAGSVGTYVNDVFGSEECISFTRIDVAKTPRNEASVAEMWGKYANRLIAEYGELASKISPRSRSDAVMRQVDEVMKLRVLIEAHAHVMEDNSKKLLTDLDDVSATIAAKIAEHKKGGDPQNV